MVIFFTLTIGTPSPNNPDDPGIVMFLLFFGVSSVFLIPIYVIGGINKLVSNKLKTRRGDNIAIELKKAEIKKSYKEAEKFKDIVFWNSETYSKMEPLNAEDRYIDDIINRNK